MANISKCKECGHLTLRISWSGLRTHEECKQKGYLTRTGKKSKMDNGRMFFPGTVTDRTVRDWLADDPYNNPGLMPDMVESIVNREYEAIRESENGIMLWKSKDDKSAVIKECQEAVRKIEPSLNEKVLPYDYDVDFRFQAPLTIPHPDGGMETIILIGFMDIITRETTPEGFLWDIWDVKHTRDDYYWKKTQGQLGFYDLSNWVMTGDNTRNVGLLQPLCKEPVKPVGLSYDTRSVLLQRINAMAWDIWNDDKTPRIDNTLCNYCPVKHACSKFQPVQVGKHRRISFS